MSNRSRKRNAKVQAARNAVANRWYWRWLPNRSWQAMMFIGLGTATMILFISWEVGLPTGLNIRAAVVAVLWLFFSALVYGRDRAISRVSTLNESHRLALKYLESKRPEVLSPEEVGREVGDHLGMDGWGSAFGLPLCRKLVSEGLAVQDAAGSFAAATK